MSERRPKAARTLATAGMLLALSLSVAGCATVRPDQRELLADPAMTFGANAETAGQEQHVLTNREGSFGAGGVSGGGCGCN